MLSKIAAWILNNPDRALWLVGTLCAVILRFTSPGSRATAIFTSLPGDLVKLYCAITGKVLPGGFSPAPAAIPSTTAADAKMPDPVPTQPSAS